MKDKVWYRDPDTRQLVSAYEKHPKSKSLEAASPMTVTLNRVVIGQDYDSCDGDNDLFIMSRSATGEKRPKVDRFHAYQEEVPENEPVPGMYNDIMFVEDDYNGKDRLWLELHIRDVDMQKEEIDSAVSSFQRMTAVAGSVFPVALPYMFGAGAAASLAGALLNWLQQDDPALDLMFALYPGDPVVGNRVLQTGTYVAFNGRKDGTVFTLEQDGSLLKNGQEVEGVTYAVIHIHDEKKFEPKEILSQKISTLLAQMKQDAAKTDSKVEAFDFLTDTMTKYDQYEKLVRYGELKTRAYNGEKLSEKEKQLMDSISKMEALKEYLPT